MDWNNILKIIKEKDIKLYAVLKEGEVEIHKDDEIFFWFDNIFFAKKIKNKKSKIENILSKITNKEFKILISYDGEHF